ncbi:MAG: GGDEF domain-containing protein [Treponema sp.]|nr:GGDEF domain-containing protein [Treponema sp.]
MQFRFNHFYKPKRILYFVPADQNRKEDFFNCKYPKELIPYIGAFGTYDYPGLFVLNTDEYKGSVLGMEFRPDDDRISYPEGLDSVCLPGVYVMAVDVLEVEVLNDKVIDEVIDTVLHTDINYRKWTNAEIAKNPSVRQLFYSNDKIRIYFECLDTGKVEMVRPEGLSDVTKEQLYDIAFFDNYTGARNWRYIRHFLFEHVSPEINDFCFAIFDVKSFRMINELFSHIIANHYLIRISETLKKQDWIYESARCDNDNFAVIFKDMEEDEIRRKFTELFESLSPLDPDSKYQIFFRCGVVPMRATMLMDERVADAAKLAKSLGNKINKNEILFYTEKMYDDLFWADQIRAYLDTAIANDEFLVYMQPKYDVASENLKGAEALVRWNFKGVQFLPPSRFIPFFERIGLIGKVDDVVLHKVCECLCRWKKEGRNVKPVSVNLSRKQLENPNLLEYLCRVVDSYGVEHSLVDFELTESATYEDKDYMLALLNKLKKAGFSISIDDFGTGYSSLSLLADMPIDTLKIDKSFVDRLESKPEDSKDVTLVRHIIMMAKDLRFHCLAEGAESKSQVERLRSLGCETIQGYYYSKPVPVCEYEKLL